MSTGKKHTLGKSEKLKSRKQIDGLFGGGKSFFVHPVKVFYQFSELVAENQSADDSPQTTEGQKVAANTVQIGVSASKRNFKKAVDRNRVKRLLREAYRLNKQELLDATEHAKLPLHVFFIYVDKTLPTFALLEEKMKACLKRLVKIVGDQK